MSLLHSHSHSLSGKMAALSHFSAHIFSSPNHTTPSFPFFHHHHHHHHLQSFFHSNRQFSAICLAYSRKSRPSRKLMNDEELRNVLREFVASVGLPEGHVPSTKELSQHGRKDLANIVRRRGHKLIKELLTNSSEIATDGFYSLENLNADSNLLGDQGMTGQEEKLNDAIEMPIDIASTDEDSAAGTALDITSTNDDSAAGTALAAQYDSSFVSKDESLVSKEPTMSLQEKVDNFMKYGQLDAVEDDTCGELNLNDGNTILNHGKNSIEPMMQTGGGIKHLTHNNFGQNGTLLLPKLFAPPTVEDNYKRDIHSSAQRPQNANSDNNMHTEGSKMDNEEINFLKQILHQKELELSRLKEDIEREKQALSILQAKAENEISKAQKLISEKDAELNAAEESLSGLVEAKIHYTGEGQMVEVAGSFNGWHQRIKLDPQPSSILDPAGSRKLRLWSATLWLYPGLYEIKFIVDGHWKIDPQRETTIMGGIENNILRVDR